MDKILTKEEFDGFIKTNEDNLAVCKFGAPWCQPCNLLSTIIEEVSPIDGVAFAEVNVDEADEEFVSEFNIRNVPTMLFYKNGLQIDRTTGMIGKDALKNKIEENKNK